MKINDILKQSIELDASDTYIGVDKPLAWRIKKKVVVSKDDLDVIYRQDIHNIVNDLTRNASVLFDLYDGQEIDGSYTILDKEYIPHYFRFNIAQAQKKPNITIRKLINKVPDPQSIGLDRDEGLDFYNSCLTQKEGLYLVVGATGSGKSTTLTCIVDSILKSGGVKAVTLEAPIEYYYNDMDYEQYNSIIVQRDVGYDTKSFDMGLRAAMRQNPDLILLGEIRDKETAASALQAANTGHQVLATLHASSVELAIERIRFLVGDITNDYSFVRAIMSQKLVNVNGVVKPVRDVKIFS